MRGRRPEPLDEGSVGFLPASCGGCYYTAPFTDLKRQFEDKSDHLGMVGEVLETLIHQQHDEFSAGPERETDPRL